MGLREVYSLPHMEGPKPSLLALWWKDVQRILPIIADALSRIHEQTMGGRFSSLKALVLSEEHKEARIMGTNGQIQDQRASKDDPYRNSSFSKTLKDFGYYIKPNPVPSHLKKKKSMVTNFCRGGKILFCSGV